MTLFEQAPLLGIVDFGVWDALRDVLLLLLVASRTITPTTTR